MSDKLLSGLTALNLQEYAPGLIENGFDDWDAVQSMEPEDLREMATVIGMKAGHRMKLEKALRGKASKADSSSETGPEEVPIVVGEQACINRPGIWPFFISYTQRSGKAEVLANKIWTELKDRGHVGWLDKQMDLCDTAAMEEGVKNSSCVISVLSGDGDEYENRYFQRSACVAELTWAVAAGKPVVCVVQALDKPRVGEYLYEGKSKGIDLTDCQVVDFNDSSRVMTTASIDWIQQLMEFQQVNGSKAKFCDADPRLDVNKPRAETPTAVPVSTPVPPKGVQLHIGMYDVYEGTAGKSGKHMTRQTMTQDTFGTLWYEGQLFKVLKEDATSLEVSAHGFTGTTTVDGTIIWAHGYTSVAVSTFSPAAPLSIASTAGPKLEPGVHVAQNISALGGRIIRLRSVFWTREYVYAAAGSGPTPVNRYVLTMRDPKEPTTNKKDWLVELVPGKPNQIRLRNMYWNGEYMYTAASSDPNKKEETRAVLTHKDPNQPTSDKKDWEIELVPGTTNQIRLRSAFWNREYLYATSYKSDDPKHRTRPIRVHTNPKEPTSNKKDFEIEFA